MAVGDVVQTFINSANVGVLSGTGLTVGDLAVVWGRFFGESSAPTFVDSVGNTWHASGVGFANGSSFCEFWWSVVTHTSFSLNFTGAGSFPQIAGAQFSSAGSSWALGGTTPASSTGSQSSGVWSASAFAVAVGDLVIGFWENETANGITFSDAGGFTWIGNSSAGNVTMSSKIATGTSETAEITTNQTANVGWMTASFTPSAGGGGGTRSYSFVLG